MKPISFLCATFFALLLAGGVAHAQDYEEQARMREDQARKIAELLVVEGQINVLQTEIDELNRKEAGTRTKEEISPEITALEKERAEIIDSLPKVGDLKTRIEADAENIRKSYFELKEYIRRLEQLQTQNVFKTVMRLGMEAAQELQAFVTLSGKPVEIAKWAAEKAADPIVKAIVSYGGPEYYSRKMQGLSDQAAAVTPELQRVKDLSSLSLEGWRSYMVKYEDKDIKGNNGLILGKVRVLLEQTNKALWVLVDLYNALDREAKALEVEMEHMRERQKDIEKRLEELKQKDEEATSPDRKAAIERKKLLLTEISPLLQKRDSLRREIDELTKKLGHPARMASDMTVERKVERYKNLRNKLISESTGYALQASRMENEMQSLLGLHDQRQLMQERQEKEFKDLIEKRREKPSYPYTEATPGDVKTDTEALFNYVEFGQEWTGTEQRHLAEQRKILSEIESAAASLDKELNSPPHDPLSEKILRNAVGDAGNAAWSAITQEIRRLQFAGEDRGQRRWREMDILKAEVEQLMQNVPASPYQKIVEARMEGRNASGPLGVIAAEILSNTKNLVDRNKKAHQNRDLSLEEQKKEREKTASKYRKEIEERRNNYRTAARAFLSLGRDHLSRLEDAFAARTAYASYMKSLVSSGMLKEASESSYLIDPAYIEKTLGNTPKTCQAIDLLRDHLAASAASSSTKLAAAQAANRQITLGAPPAPISDWGVINEPSVHQDVVSLNKTIKDMWGKITQLPYMPSTNPLISFVNSVTTNNANLIINYPSFFNTMQQTIRESDAMVKAAMVEASSLEKSQRIRTDDLKRLQEWHKRLQDAHETDFGCFEPDHIYNQSIPQRLDELKKKIEQLKSKPLYAAAAALIAELSALKETIARLAVSEEDGYAQQVATLRQALDSAQARFKSQESAFYAGDASTMRELLYAIEQGLRPHEDMVRNMQSRPKIAAVSNEQIQSLYQDFITAYGNGNLRGLISLLDENWTGGDGADIRDVEDVLINSFKVFDRIQYRISAFKSQPLADGTSQISYQVNIIGQNRRQNLTHEESSNVVEIVGLSNGRAKILRTVSGNQWMK